MSPEYRNPDINIDSEMEEKMRDSSDPASSINSIIFKPMKYRK
jgi:hypothetical protein